MSRILAPLSAKHGQLAFGLICSAELTLALALLAYREYASALVTAFLGLSIALCWWSWTQAYQEVEGKRNPTPTTCRPPAECGLIQNERGMWQSPGPDEPIWPKQEQTP